MILSDEQLKMIFEAKKGVNILVDACIGSGKTTTIQALCNELSDKSILYLTYNRLLKIDAKRKICNKNVFVQNYHGFAYCVLSKLGKRVGYQQLVKEFNILKPEISQYDLLVLDEYQDINQDIAEMLLIIKEQNPEIQIIAVGDMNQKIYDSTSLNILKFIENFLEDYKMICFTKCFRLSKKYAQYIGNIWNKDIVGVNEHCQVETMNIKEVTNYLAVQNTKDILCLGSRTSKMSNVLNELENKYPFKFNKYTVYASISDEDRNNTKISNNCAIFTTFDSSKGMERPICVVFDFTENYWESRLQKPNVKYEILKNIFCVAMSRGKEKIIFVVPDKNTKMLNEKILSTPVTENDVPLIFNISDMFSFKYEEDVFDCYKMLNIEKIHINDKMTIDIKREDGLIDLSPCIGIYQEALFFKNYDIDSEVAYAKIRFPKRPPLKIKEGATLEDKILYLTAYETYQDRYITQVELPFITDSQKENIYNRLSTIFNSKEDVQYDCSMDYISKNNKQCFINGRVDVLKNEIVYELKFVSELSYNHFLQCACYMLAINLNSGILWNIKTNDMFKISIPNKNDFLHQVIKTITKGLIDDTKELSSSVFK